MRQIFPLPFVFVAVRVQMFLLEWRCPKHGVLSGVGGLHFLTLRKLCDRPIGLSSHLSSLAIVLSCRLLHVLYVAVILYLFAIHPKSIYIGKDVADEGLEAARATHQELGVHSLLYAPYLVNRSSAEISIPAASCGIFVV